MAKYFFTPEMDKEIHYTYSVNTDSKPRVINLAKKFNMPRWAIYQKALKIGAVTSSHQKKPWSEGEIKILEKYTCFDSQTIRKKLAKAGFQRSMASIVLKRKGCVFSRTLNVCLLVYVLNSLALTFTGC